MKKIILVIHALIIWALCGATIMIGRNFMSMQLTLIVHAIGAPIFAFVISYFYFKRYNSTTPIQTALIVLFVIILMDAGLVAPVFEGSYDMFKNPLGTWIPFALIFLATFVSGKLFYNKK